MTRQGRGDDAPLLVKMILTPPSLLMAFAQDPPLTVAAPSP